MIRNFFLSRLIEKVEIGNHPTVIHASRHRARRWCAAGAMALVLAVAAGKAQSVFPANAVGTAAAQQAVTVSAQAAGTVAHVSVVTLGQPGLDFALPTIPASSCAGVTLTVGGATPSCSQSVAFTPIAPGLRLGAVELFDAGGDLLGEALISGIGTGGLAVLVPGNVLPVAGNGNYLDPVEDNVPALNAELDSPTAVAMDGAGNLFIADSEHNRIRMVSAATGEIATVAGTGAANYTGDNNPATSATLNTPSGIALDGAGNLYIADTGNNAIRRVDAVTHIIPPSPEMARGSPVTAGMGRWQPRQPLCSTDRKVSPSMRPAIFTSPTPATSAFARLPLPRTRSPPWRETSTVPSVPAWAAMTATALRPPVRR